MTLRLAPLLLALTAAFAHAEKADRLKPLTLSSDKGGSVDNVNQARQLVGNVIITQGSLVLRAEKVDVRETRDGYVQAFATGAAGQPVTFRQGRDKPGETIDGVAEQVEYDTRSETVRFIGNARVRTISGAAVDEMSGAAIVYNSRTEVTTLEAGNGSPNPNGRARIVIMPPAQPGNDAASAPPAALPLKPSTTLQPGKPS